MYRHLLVPVDDTELSQKAMTASVGLAGRLGASITGLTVEPSAPSLGAGHSASHYLQMLEQHTEHRQHHAHVVMARFEALAAAQGVTFRGRYVCTGMVEDAIAQIARMEGCDLVVMATHGRTGFDEFLQGSRTKGVLEKTSLPVLVLR